MSADIELEHWQDYLKRALPRGCDHPLIVRVYRETRSTQDIAKLFAPKATLVVAEQQTAGRGRLGRAWLSAPGSSVLMSVCWPIADMTTTHDRVSMLTGVVVVRAIMSLRPNTAVRLKWPNDVMIDERKLAGILIEAVKDAFIIGIGLNLTPESIADPSINNIATYLNGHGCRADPLLVIERIVMELDRALKLPDQETTLNTWRAHASLGQTQTFEQHGQQITGQVLDLDPDHGLIVRRDSGEIVTLPAATTSVVK